MSLIKDQVPQEAADTIRKVLSMPHVDLWCPEDILEDEEFCSSLMTSIQEIVAGCMSGYDYDGLSFRLDPHDVTVMLHGYKAQRARLAAQYDGRITGYDYPHRTQNLARILTEITDDTAAAILVHLNADLATRERMEAERRAKNKKFVAFSFIDQARGSCVATMS